MALDPSVIPDALAIRYREPFTLGQVRPIHCRQDSANATVEFAASGLAVSCGLPSEYLVSIYRVPSENLARTR